MILNDEEIKESMESPVNLMNRLKSVTKSNQNLIPSLPPSAEDIIENLEDKLAEGKSLKTHAATIMKAAMTELEKRLPEVQKPERLAAIAAEMNKVVNATTNSGDEKLKGAQVIIYAPQFRTEDSFEVITVNE